MEKTTKKKKSKGLKRRIGIIAIGGLSLVLTICLSVGATLAWFAGSTSASNTMYMGGPVYVEMAGRGLAAGTAGSGDVTQDGAAKWVGGSGNLDIIASARNTGTVNDGSTRTGEIPADYTQVLLPGQKLMIYSQARVFSTNETTTVNDGWTNSQSSGANTTNTQNGTAQYRSKKGRVTTTTTSVLRAKFSINVEFDPSVGINNFTATTFANNYPVKSSNYTGDGETTDVAWYKALGAEELDTSVSGTGSTATYTYTGRRDAITSATYTGFGKLITAENTGAPATGENLTAIKAGTKVSIYKWKYVSRDEWTAADTKWRMGAPFDGTKNSAGENSNTNGGIGNGFYGLWVSSDGAYDVDTGSYVESDSFYKARTQAYLKSYREHYVDEYERNLVMGYEASLTKLEESLNESFRDLVNWSSDAIISGAYAGGFNATTAGVITGASGTGINASWLYVDPNTPGATDTNAADSATNMGGWWYLVESNNGSVAAGLNQVTTVTDTNETTGDHVDQLVHTEAAGQSFQRAGTTQTSTGAYVTIGNGTGETAPTAAGGALTSSDVGILNAKLYEISPSTPLTTEVVGHNGSTDVVKTVSISFPFVNGSFELPGRELTNNFANAKITFQISFQALQAFFPYTRSIDGLTANNSLLGVGKALNIKNAVPIFNEAFDYLAYLNMSD